MAESTDQFVRRTNIENFTKQLESLPAGVERVVLLNLLTEEKAKGRPAKPVVGC